MLRTLHDMASHGIIKESMLLSALLRHRVGDASGTRLQRVIALERALLALRRETAPDADADAGAGAGSDGRRLNQQLLDQGQDGSNPDTLRALLYSLSQDDRGLAGRRGSLRLRQVGHDELRVKLGRHWPALIETAERCHALVQCGLAALQAHIPPDTTADAQLQVEFSLEDLVVAIQRDLLLAEAGKDPLNAAERALLFLHEQQVIHLQNGLAVFRQAMTIRIPPEQRQRRYSQGDYKPLSPHYAQRVF